MAFALPWYPVSVTVYTFKCLTIVFLGELIERQNMCQATISLPALIKTIGKVLASPPDPLSKAQEYWIDSLLFFKVGSKQRRAAEVVPFVF